MDVRYEILQFLYSKTLPVTSTILQDTFKVSRRSIINYISQLNNESPNLILSTSRGYEIAKREDAVILIEQASKQFSHYGYEKRKRIILSRLLLDKELLSAQDLADELYVSELTITKDLAKLRNELKQRKLFIRTKNEQIFIVGKEKDRQKFLMDLLSEEWQVSQFNVSSIQHFFKIANINEINTIIKIILEEENFDLDDFSLLNYVLHLSILIETSFKNPHSVEHIFEKSNYEFSTHFYRFIVTTYERLKEVYPDCNFTQEQIAEASLLMSTRVMPADKQWADLQNLENYVGSEVNDLMSVIIRSLYDNFGINVNNEDFIVRFAFHLKNLILRVRDKIMIPLNPITEIKDDYPFLYMIANHISSLISTGIDCKVPDNETMYLTLHLGALLADEKNSIENISCVLVMYDYLNLGNRIFEQISSQINYLHLTDIVSSYEDIKNIEEVDLILSTLSVNPSVDVSQVQISQLLTKQDIRNVAEKVEFIRNKREKEKIRQIFIQLFEKDLFFTDIPFSESNEIISFLCEKLVDMNYVDKEFINDILEHEKITPTEYNNVAIPHPLLSDGSHIKSSAIAVYINRDPVTWINNKVNFVFMLALLPKDIPLFPDVFNIVVSVLNDKKTSEKILDCINYDDFIELILSNYEIINIM